jgi:hypothetical protein
MVTFAMNIPPNVSIYTSTMDPMGIGIPWRIHQPYIGMMDAHVEGILAANKP